MMLAGADIFEFSKSVSPRPFPSSVPAGASHVVDRQQLILNSIKFDSVPT